MAATHLSDVRSVFKGPPINKKINGKPLFTFKITKK